MATRIQTIEELCINSIRTLSIDAVEKARSGHPGMPLGAATMAYVLWTRHLHHHPRSPAWPDRDRFVLSAGHASMLLYSLLFLTGYDLTLDDLKQFRQWGSRTPGHPEHGLTPGVEVTTGPLGQGFGNAVGLAMAERWLAATLDRPSLIVARTHIGYGSPHRQDTFQAHGEPLGEEEVRATKRALGWPEDKTFYVPDEALREFRKAVEHGAALEEAWRRKMDAYRAAHPEPAGQFERALAGDLPEGWEAKLPAFTPKDGEMATRDAGAKVLTALADAVPNLIGGSADLDPSTRTMMKGHGDFEGPAVPPAAGGPPLQGAAGGVWGYAGRNIHFGVREHAMAAILTGLALHGGVLPFGATFLTFSDYMRPSIRLAALSKARVLYIWTHDSIGLGEDGPTHQPVEHLAGLRATPDLLMLRPADATETVEAWRAALRH